MNFLISVAEVTILVRKEEEEEDGRYWRAVTR
jgi:hypothetical protein